MSSGGRHSCLALLALLFVTFAGVAACKDQQQPPSEAPGGGPQVRAVELTITTTVQPSNERSTHTILIGPEVARSTNEVLHWRLYDFTRNTVTFVDDAAKSYRTEPLQTLLARRHLEIERFGNRDMPEAKVETTSIARTLHGVAASQAVIQVGKYRRELWIGSHPAIPPQLFAMLHVSQRRTTPPSGEIESFLLSVEGYPLSDHSELPYGDTKIVIDRLVSGIVARQVDQSLFVIPADYTDATKPAENPRSAS